MYLSGALFDHNSLFLTSETEASALVGAYSPAEKGSDNTGSPVVWRDGIVTEAVRMGKWVVLDNIAEAEAQLLERLNPVLELPPSWSVSERDGGG